MAQRQKPPCCRGLPAPTPPGTSPEDREEKTKHQSPTSPSAAAFYWAEVWEAKHSHTTSLLHTPGTPHCYSNILTHHLHPARWTTLKGLIPEPQSQNSSSTTCFLSHAPSSSCPTNLQQLNTGTTRSAGKKRQVLPPAPHLFPQGLANHPQLQAPWWQVQAAVGEQPGIPAPALAALLSHRPLLKGPSSGFGLMHQRISCYWSPRDCLLAHIWD